MCVQEVGSSVKRLLALEAGMGLAAHEDKHAPAGAAVLMRGHAPTHLDRACLAQPDLWQPGGQLPQCAALCNTACT